MGKSFTLQKEPYPEGNHSGKGKVKEIFPRKEPYSWIKGEKKASHKSLLLSKKFFSYLPGGEKKKSKKDKLSSPGKVRGGSKKTVKKRGHKMKEGGVVRGKRKKTRESFSGKKSIVISQAESKMICLVPFGRASIQRKPYKRKGKVKTKNNKYPEKNFFSPSHLIRT